MKLKGRRKSKNVVDKRGYIPSASEGAHRTGRMLVTRIQKGKLVEGLEEQKAANRAKKLGMGDVGKKMTGALRRDAIANYKKRKGKK